MKLLEMLDSPEAPLRWREIREEIHKESDLADSPEKFDSLRQAFKAIMDIAEQKVPAEHMAIFREAREKDYKLLVIREALVKGSVCVEMLHAVTTREIAAGRMAGDHSLRKLAEKGMAAPHLSRAELLAGAAEKASSPSKPWWKFWK